MQSKINNGIQFGHSLNPLKYVTNVSSIDNISDLHDAFTKINKLKKLWDDGSMDYDLIRYLPGMAKYQGRGTSIACTHKEYMRLLTGLILGHLNSICC